MEAEYLQTALNATRLAIRLRAGREGEVGRLVLLLQLAELEERWKELGGRHPDLLSPRDIRLLLPTLHVQPSARIEWLGWLRRLANGVGRALLSEMPVRPTVRGVALQRRFKSRFAIS